MAMYEQKVSLTKVLVCHNTTCKQQGAPQVLRAFERSVPDGIVVEEAGCLGQCGQGPMVIVLRPKAEGSGADKTWYAGVSPAEAFAIAAKHFKADASSPLQKAAFERQPQKNTIWIWLVGLVLFFALCGMFALTLGGPAHYG